MTTQGARRSRRTWPQRLVICCNVLAIVAAGVTAASLAYSNDRVAQINRNYFEEGVLATDELEVGDPQNFLIVGVDDASGLDEGDVVRRRPTGSRLTDTIMVLRVDPGATTADILSFPRDLLVDIPGRTSRARINSAFETGGHELLVRTIAENFAIPIHHYVEVDFAGFRELVGVVGGIPVYFPHPVRSLDSVQLEIPTAGCWTLGPVQALGFARARKDYQVQDLDGDWHTDLGGDYSRVERQQLFIQLALRQAIAKGARNPNTLRQLIDLGIASVGIDDGLEPEMAIDLGRTFRAFDPAAMVTHTLPVDEAPAGGPAYLYLREEEAEPTLALFRGGDPGMAGEQAPVLPEDVTVQVRNGTGTANQARDVTGELADAGFSTLVPGVDGSPGFPTVIQYAAGSEAHARVVASWLEADVVYQLAELPVGVDAILLTGDDWVGVRDLPREYGQVAAPETTTPTTTTTEGEGTLDGVPGEDPSTATDPADGSSTTGSSLPAGDEGEPVGDVNDPDDPAFFRATAPPPGAECPPTE